MNAGLKAVGDTAAATEALRLELERCQRELEECRRRRGQLEHLFAHVADAVFVAQPDGQIIDVNPAACKMLGYTREELLALRPWDFVTGESREEILEVAQSITPGSAVTLQRTGRSKNGEPLVVDLRLTRCDHGGRDLIILSCRDATERARAQRALQESEERFRRMADAIPEVIWFTTLAPEKVVYVSPSFERIWGLPVESLYANPRLWTETIHPDDRERVTRTFSRWIAGEKVSYQDVEYRILTPKGGTRWIHERGVLSLNEQGQPCLASGISTDITERHQVNEALRASEHLARGQLKALTHTLDSLAQELDPDKLLEHVLRTILEQSGAHSVSVWERNEDGGWLDLIAVIEDGRFQTREDAVHPAGRLAILAQDHPVWSEVLRTGQHAVLEEIDQESARMRVGSDPDALWHRMLDHPDPGSPMARLKEHLQSLGVVAILFVPMLVAGHVVGIIGIRFQQKRTVRREEIELTRALAHQAMLAIQLMRLSRQSRESAVIAERNRMARDMHDTLAQGFTGVIVQLEAAEDAKARGLAGELDDHLRRASELARDSLQEARRSVRALRPQALEEKNLCEALEDLFRKMTAGTTILAKFIRQGRPQPIPPEWDENLLRIGQEVLTNALRHARATEFKTQLVFDPQEIRLELRDNGRGFDPRTRHDGFGLLGIRERVEGMGGQLTLESAAGQGTAILIVLPLGKHASSSPT